MFIQLHARGCMLLVVLWIPFKKCYSRMQSHVDTKTTIIDIFASFLVLSYVKFLSVTFDILVPTHIYNIHGKSVGLYLYYDASYEYFGREHLPYGILALFVAFFFLLLPSCASPTSLSSENLSKVLQRYFGHWQSLRIFMDSFQGSFKDGVTEGCYDCRYFSAVYLIARIVFFIAYALTLSAYFYVIFVVILMTLALFVIVIQPYRKSLSIYGTVDVVFILLMAIWNGSIMALDTASTNAIKSLNFSFVLLLFAGSFPLLYIPIILLRSFSKNWSCLPFLKNVYLRLWHITFFINDSIHGGGNN